MGKVSLEYLSGIFIFLQQHSSDMLKQRENRIWSDKICPAAPNQPIRQQSSRCGDACTAHVRARAAQEGCMGFWQHVKFKVLKEVKIPTGGSLSSLFAYSRQHRTRMNIH